MSLHAYASCDSPPSHTLLDQNLDPRVIDHLLTRYLDCPCELNCLDGCDEVSSGPELQAAYTDVLFQIKENCSAGCPCSEFDCIETTSAPKVTTATVPRTTTSPTGNAVLVLSTRDSNNKPFIVDFNGELRSVISEIFISFKETSTKT